MDILMQLLPTVVSACIGAIASVITFSMSIQHRLTKLETKMDALDDKVDKHNNVIERTFLLEGKVTALEHQIH